MLTKCSRITGPSLSCGIELDTMWEVYADPSYNNRQGWTCPGNLIAIKTLSGKGGLHLSGIGKVELRKDTLIIIEKHQMKQYYCDAENWDFWWFEFTLHGALPFPLQRVLNVISHVDDKKDFDKCLNFLPRMHFTQRALGSAIFCTMLYRWIATWGGEIRAKPHQKEIEAVIAKMHQRLDGFPLKEMAKMAFLSERRFRQVFIELQTSLFLTKRQNKKSK